ncbi:glycosyltransferase family 4 protein [Salinigranum halophilum]|uniref:glycosyltransferase family 4 protein n=1 Tax=Salinigranum halophilum TaxID=2565931 RepID=UPI001F1A8227|nr:glycosyltransferase family 4 protein [Salinigranum halophilum]
MKIALLSIMYPPDAGGAETYAYELSRALAARGHDVDVYTATTEPIPSDLDLPDGVSVERLFERKKVPVAETIYYSLRARAAVDFDEYDVVHGTLMPASTIALTPGLGMADVPLVVTSHGTSLGEFRSHNPHTLIDYLLKYGLHPGNFVLDNVAGRVADRVIAISDHVAEELRDTYGFGDKVTMIPHGVDTDRFRPHEEVHPTVGPEKFTVLTVGRLGSRKGIGLAIRGIAALDDPDVEFLIAGTGRHEERLRTLARDLGVADQVRFLGYVPDEELPLLYSSADVFSLTSRYEGLGLVLLEAMACGTPVVATDVGGIPTVVEDGVNGTLIPREPEAFASAVEHMSSRRGLKSDCRSYAIDRTWDAIAERVEAIHKGTAARAHHQPSI